MTHTFPPKKDRPVVLSAVKPTSILQLGNYLGALKHWVRMQHDHDCLFFIVDLHAITMRQDPAELRERTYQVTALYLAAGLDPEKILLFPQSQVPEHAELGWILTCFTHMGELGRMTQFKDKSQTAGQNIGVGLFMYPVLMAADILLYQTDLVPVGDDQKQHVELTRDIAERVNGLFPSSSGPMFTVPKPHIPPVGARIMSLADPEAKMSKSDDNDVGSIFLLDSDETIRKKVKRATTDSGSVIAWSDSQPGVKNLLTIQACITGKTPDELVAGYAGKQYGHLKVDTAEIIVGAVAPIRAEAERFLKDRGELDRLFARHAERARARAAVTLDELKRRVGFIAR